MQTTISLDSLWQLICTLPPDNQRWLEDKLQSHLRNHAMEESIGKEELIAGIDAGLKDLKAGRTRPAEDLLAELRHEVPDKDY